MNVSRMIGQTAVRALVQEACLFPKPGLVDPAHRGAHHDMDFATLLRSAFSLEEYFTFSAKSGLSAADDFRLVANPDLLFPELRHAGREAERRMFAATHGINTHKGAIFSLGLLSAACGILIAAQSRCIPISDAGSGFADMLPEVVCILAGRIAKGIVQRDLGRINGNVAASHGEAVYMTHGCAGIRGEAESGFPALRTLVVPVFLTAGPHSALLASMSSLDDSCILARGGPGALAYVKERSRELYKRFSGTSCMSVPASTTSLSSTNGFSATPHPVANLMTVQEFCFSTLSAHPVCPHFATALLDLDRDLVERNLSPGGSADMLACSIFLADSSRIAASLKLDSTALPE